MFHPLLYVYACRNGNATNSYRTAFATFLEVSQRIICVALAQHALPLRCPVRKLMHAIYGDFSAVENENHIGKLFPCCLKCFVKYIDCGYGGGSNSVYPHFYIVKLV